MYEVWWWYGTFASKLPSEYLLDPPPRVQSLRKPIEYLKLNEGRVAAQARFAMACIAKGAASPFPQCPRMQVAGCETHTSDPAPTIGCDCGEDATATRDTSPTNEDIFTPPQNNPKVTTEYSGHCRPTRASELGDNCIKTPRKRTERTFTAMARRAECG